MVGICPPTLARRSDGGVMVLSVLVVILLMRTVLIVTMMMVLSPQLHVDEVRILLRMTGVILPVAAGLTLVLESSS